MQLTRNQIYRLGSRHISSKPQSSKTYVQEHDYTVTPSTYVYTTDENQELFERFPLVNAKSLARRKERPRKTRMLSREFIDDSMYNPHYGYFSKHAEIFSLKDKFQVNRMHNIDSFLDRWALEYRKQQKKETEKAVTQANRSEAAAQRLPESERKNMKSTKVSRQLWHTPSELFTPHYGRALARYIVDECRKQNREHVTIYETGAGNGTLMVDILNYLKETHPELYRNTHYNIIEISASLALKQRAHIEGHKDKVSVHNCSIFDWTKVETEPCFFIALEVWDNLAHDVIRYDNTSGKPYQGYTVVDANGDFTEVFSPKIEKWAQQFLEARSSVDYKPNRLLGWHPLAQPSIYKWLKNAIIPFQGNLSTPEYIPTRYFQLLHTLKERFPQHQLLAADFTHFTERIRGYNSPVVQTFMEDTPVTVSTYMVLQGYFDIMFPTDFKLAQQLYEHVMGRPAQSAPHGEFLKQWVDSKESTTKAGENPMITLYKNAAFLYS